ncbi:MAG: flagellar export protein FliJ [Candidatus Methylomirabilota bacterium]|nr:flagellar export protein FliJ [Candidatus Methylomirabilis sp.]NJD68874.1 flagellar export protein FliJ [candidate division NC10 bacterium]PWB43986.1 MAG: flagellar export protein FliJ [candidate division NC10 bacterium]
MKRFRFPLQSVLAIREAKVDQAEAALAERQRSCRALRERLARLKDAEAEALAGLAMGERTAQPGPSPLPIRSAYLLGLGEQIGTLEAKLAAEQTEVVRLRQVLLERSREEQIIEHLRRRKVKMFRSEMVREQQIEIDEIAGARRAAIPLGRSVS